MDPGQIDPDEVFVYEMAELKEELKPLMLDWLDSVLGDAAQSLLALVDGEEWSDTSLAQEGIFPPSYTSYVFDRDFLVGYLGVIRRMQEDPWGRPTCVAHEMTLWHLCMNAWDDRFEEVVDSVLDDIDFIFLWERTLSEVEEMSTIEELNVVNLHPTKWLDPFRPEEFV